MKPGKKNSAAKFLAVALILLLVAVGVRAAGPFNVNSTNDTHVLNTTTGTDTNGNITLRSAIEAANADGGAVINIQSGTYNLTLGELDIAPSGFQNTSIVGNDPTKIFIVQTDGTNRVFNIDSFSVGNTVVTINGVSIQGGHDLADNLGGAGILAGSLTNTPIDTLNLIGCNINNNHCVEVTHGYTANPGGGVQMAGGNLYVNNCTFANNTSGASFGGAIFFFNQVVTASLGVSNTVFQSNGMTNDSGSGPDGGGAIMILSTFVGSTHTFLNNSFLGNYDVGLSGNTYGGAIQMNGGTLNASACTFITNGYSGAGSVGGAIYVDSGTLNISYCRFVNNIAPHATVIYNHTSNGAVTTANNNWWNSNTGPGTNDLVGSSAANYIVLTHHASPSTIPANSSTTLNASIVTNSAGTALSTANLTAMIGVPITFFNATKGTISSPLPAIQANGTATAKFNATPGLAGTATVQAQVDNVTATATINIECPSISAVLTGGGTICSGSSIPLTVTVIGGAPPYSVQLNNGGGTQVGFSPLTFNVSPTSDTTYAISLGSDADSCILSTSGTATVNVNPTPVATINVNPASVCAYSAGNTATGPSGMSGYAWTIGNGTISGPANSQTVSYIAGSSGSVTLGLTVTNSSGCSSNNSAIVPINPLPSVTVTANPPVVSANSPDNQASAPGGASGYFWTITNGVITSANNGQTITYIAGNEGEVGLGVTVTNASGCTSNSSAVVPITQPALPPGGWSFRTNYFPSITFSNALNTGLLGAVMPITYDGSNYWSTFGGETNGARFAQYDTNGNLLATFSPGLDFRSVFTDGYGTVLARQYADSNIYVQTSPGMFVPSGVALNGGSLNSQSSVVLNGAGTEYDALSSGVVTRWNPDGNLIGTVTLQGYGTLSGENSGVTGRGLAAFGNFWLTYNGAGIVSVWDMFGNRLANCTLAGAGTSQDSEYSFSYCNGKVFVVDSPTGLWRGYDVGSSGQVAIYGAPGSPSWNGDVQSKILGTKLFIKVDTNYVAAPNPVPTITNLMHYESVLAYDDTTFSDTAGLGNALASYITNGGGVVVATFAFTSGLALQGAISTNGDLPFTIAAQANAASQTLVEDQSTNVIFSGVTSFNGGTSGYDDLVSIANGATQIGHWSGGTPLIAIKDIPPGRIVGLNFYPPSSDARSDFWVSSTSGGALMANSLLWAGKVPPIILTGPTNLIKSGGGTATFNVTATGLPPLTYQWSKNGAVIPGATKSSLSFSSQTSSNGLYTVIVSNVYGVAISQAGTLNSPIHFLPVSLSSNGAFPLLLGAADGTPLTPYRASRISIYSTTNVTAPFATWTPVSAPLFLSNGVVWVEGLSVTNSHTFFRAAEAP